MNSLDWLCRRFVAQKYVTDPSHATDPSPATLCDATDNGSYEHIARTFDAQRQEIEKLRDQLGKARSQHQQDTHWLHSQHEKTKALLSETSNALTTAHKKTAAQRTTLKNLEETNKRLKTDINGLKRQNDGLVSQARARHSHINGLESQLRYGATASELDGLLQKLSDSRFEIEKLKCLRAPTQPALSNSSFDNGEPAAKVQHQCTDELMPWPFVVVLVDGDAYKWSRDLFVNGSETYHPGALAAGQMSRAVRDYISQHASISDHAKIIARVLLNEQGTMSRERMRNVFNVYRHDPVAFRQEFTQSFSLFDYFDAGRGKERVDRKLQETFELFISNPMCQHVFLATCTDNGFARMLEPLRFTEARSRVTLISPGYVEREIAKLDLETIMWPTVFASQKRPYDQVIRARELMTAKLEKEHNQNLNLVGAVDNVAATRVQNTIAGHETWQEEMIEKMRQVSRGVVRLGRQPGVTNADNHVPEVRVELE